MESKIIIGLVITIIVLISVVIDKNKEVKKYRKDWEFCKELLDEERAKNITK